MTEDITKKSTVVILPETSGDLVCVEYRGIITRADYQRVFDKVRSIVNSGKKFRLLVVFTPSFQGWEEDAADLNFKSIIEMGPSSFKVAYVNPPKGKILQMKLMEPAVLGTVRNFESNEFEKALTWLKEV